MFWLIAGRTIQGAGGGGIQSVSDILISDLVSLERRGLYNAALGLTWGLASAIGPLVGGALAERGKWRWIFYLNLPIVGFSAVIVVFFLNLHKPHGTLKEKFARMDWITFAGVWGVSIGGAILQNQLSKRLPQELLAQLPQGVAVAYSIIPAINGLGEPLRGEVQQAFAKSIVVIWQVLTGVAALGILISLFMKALPLNTQVDETWGLENDQSTGRGEEILPKKSD
ncbi:hypothetical protein EW026_g7966 [Hermanssonia centrifuga]|uniref:Major facilitator superfamily (MFS) profile domain-containing protein n=1 Tax=Hermanssonia centrifuga TaxID=98765 RepID=A0A4S4K7T5_9APHY|nr:hypothetical protein EW026_g7966 [Hermanssonia centrifuga]